MSVPSLRFLRKPHACNYCWVVKGLVYDFGQQRARLLWVACRCGKKHYACHDCARRVGKAFERGRPVVAECARGYYGKHKDEFAAERGGKGA